MRTGLCLGLLLLLALPASARPGGEAFQGARWGDTAADLRSRFGARLVQGECDVLLAKAKSIAGETCDRPVIPDYRVNGITFEASFELDQASGELVGVALTHKRKFDLGRDRPRQWLELAFSDMVEALTVKYGAGSPPSQRLAGEMAVHSKRWSTPDAKVLLMATYFGDDTSRDDMAVLSVSYRPVGGPDSDKL